MVETRPALDITRLRARLEGDARASADADERAALFALAARAAVLEGEREEALRLHAKVVSSQSVPALVSLVWSELAQPGYTPWELAYGLLRAEPHLAAEDRTAVEVLASVRKGVALVSTATLATLAAGAEDPFASALAFRAAAESASDDELLKLFRQRVSSAPMHERAALAWEYARLAWRAGNDVAPEGTEAYERTIARVWARAVLRRASEDSGLDTVGHARLAMALEDFADLPELPEGEVFESLWSAALHHRLAGDTSGWKRCLERASSIASSRGDIDAIALTETVLSFERWGTAADASSPVPQAAKDAEPAQLRAYAYRCHQLGDKKGLAEALDNALERGLWDDAMGRMELSLWSTMSPVDLHNAMARAVANTGDAQAREVLVAYGVTLLAEGLGEIDDVRAALALAPANSAGDFLRMAREAAAVGLSEAEFLPKDDAARGALKAAMSPGPERAHAFAELEHESAWSWAVVASAWVLAPREDTARQEALADRCLRAAKTPDEQKWALLFGLRRLPAPMLGAWVDRAPNDLVGLEFRAQARFVRALSSGHQELAAERAIEWSTVATDDDTRALAMLAAAHCDLKTRPERATRNALEAAALSSKHRSDALLVAASTGGSLRGAEMRDAPGPLVARMAIAQWQQGLLQEARNNLARIAGDDKEPSVALAAGILTAALQARAVNEPNEEFDATVAQLRKLGAHELSAVIRHARASDAVASAASLFGLHPRDATWLDWASAAFRAGQEAELIGVLDAMGVLEGVPRDLAVVAAKLARAYLNVSADEVPLPEGDGAAYALLQLDAYPPGSSPLARAEALLSTAGDDTDAQLDSYALVGWNAHAASEFVRARDAFRIVTRSRPQDVAAWEGLRRSAISLADKELEREATQALAKSVKLPSRRGLLCYRAYELDVERGDPVAADTWLRDAVHLCPEQDDWAVRWLGLSPTREDKELRALHVVEHVQGPRSRAEAHWVLALGLRDAGRTEDAAKQLSSLLKLTPNHAGALALYADMLMKLGLHEDAVAPLRRIAASMSLSEAHRVVASVGLAEVLGKRLGRADAALEALDEALLKFPDELRLVESAARYASELGQVERAREGFRRVALESPDLNKRVLTARLALELARSTEHESTAVDMLALLAELEPTERQHLIELSQHLSDGTTDDTRQRVVQVWEKLRARVRDNADDEQEVRAYALMAEALGRTEEHDAALRVLRALTPHRYAGGRRLDAALVATATSTLSEHSVGNSPARLPSPRDLGANRRDKARTEGTPWGQLLDKVSGPFDAEHTAAYILSSRTRLPALGWDSGLVWVLPHVDTDADAEAWSSYILYLLAIRRGLSPDRAMRLAVVATDEATLGMHFARAVDAPQSLRPRAVYSYILSDDFQEDRARCTAARRSTPAEEKS